MPVDRLMHNKAGNAVESVLAKAETALMAMSFVATVLIMLVVLLDVVLRYAFNAPLQWSHALISMYLMVAAFFLALPDTLNRNGHIAIDVFQSFIPVRLNHLLLGLGFAASVGFIGLIAWLGYLDALKAFVNGERLYGSFPWPTWIPKALMMAGCLVLALRCLHRAISHLASFLFGKDFVPVRVDYQITEHAE